MKVWYLPLEPYRERYTEQLLDWTLAAFDAAKVEYEVVSGGHVEGEPRRIKVGPVLDAVGRCQWALTQVAALLGRASEIRAEDWVLVEDLFTPGYEALAYVFEQTEWPHVATRNYAQSVDPDDFTFPMRDWMRSFEQIVDATANLVFVASTCHREMWQAANLGAAPVAVVGLPFNSTMVRAQGPRTVLPWAARDWLVVYSSRLDREKQPHLFMDVVETYLARRKNAAARFVVCTGADRPRSNDPTVLSRLAALERDGRIEVRCGLTKAAYYSVLAEARVQVNTARQDFVSFTALEASAYGVPTLAPAFRSFPEALANRRSQLYVPWSVEDAVGQLDRLLREGEPACVDLAQHHDGTLGRMIDAMEAFQ